MNASSNKHDFTRRERFEKDQYRWLGLSTAIKAQTAIHHNKCVGCPKWLHSLSNGNTGKAVANFFAPASKKDVEKTLWRIVNESLLVGQYQALVTEAATESNAKRRKIAAFDFV